VSGRDTHSCEVGFIHSEIGPSYKPMTSGVIESIQIVRGDVTNLSNRAQIGNEAVAFLWLSVIQKVVEEFTDRPPFLLALE